MDVYTQAVAPAKHGAQAAVLALFFPTTCSEDDDVIIGTRKLQILFGVPDGI